MFMNNVSLSFYSKRKKSINNILDQFVREFSGLFFHKYTYSILNNIKKSCEDLYLEKKNVLIFIKMNYLFLRRLNLIKMVK